MATVTLSNVDDRLLDQVRAAADRHKTSVEDEIVETLRKRFLAERQELRRRAEMIAAMTPKDVVQTDSTLIVRQIRDEGDV